MDHRLSTPVHSKTNVWHEKSVQFSYEISIFRPKRKNWRCLHEKQQQQKKTANL